jgi:transcriptional regulator with GAF, ATPase, and Fis domain
VDAARLPFGADPAKFQTGASYRETKAAWESAFERSYVAWLLAESAGNISAAARSADMDRKYLHRLARRYGLHPKHGGTEQRLPPRANSRETR